VRTHGLHFPFDLFHEWKGKVSGSCTRLSRAALCRSDVPDSARCSAN